MATVEVGVASATGKAGAVSVSSSRSRWYVAGVLVVLLLAVGARIPPLTTGLPYINYVDENHVLDRSALMLADTTWDPGWYRYPSFLTTTTAMTVGAWSVLTGDDSISEGARLSDESLYYDIVEPTAFIMAGRLIVLASSLGTVLLTVLLGTKLLGRRAGLLAGLLVAVLPALVTRSAIVMIDPLAMFFVAATLYCAAAIRPDRSGTAWALAAGATAGLAAVSKYPSGAIVIIPLVVLALSRGWTVKRRALLAGGTLAASLAAAAAAMPSLVLRAREVQADIQTQIAIYSERKSTRPGYFDELVAFHEVGLLLLIPAAIGLVLLVRSDRTRSVTIGWMLFAGFLVASGTRFDFQPFRNLLPILPFLAVAAAGAIVAGADALSLRLIRSTGASGYLAGGVTGVICFVMVTQGVSPFLAAQRDVVNSRVSAVDWMTDNLNTTDTVLVAEELAFLPSELERINAEVVVISASEGGVDPTDADYVITGQFEDETARWADPSGDPLRAFGEDTVPTDPGFWRGSSLRVQIYATDS